MSGSDRAQRTARLVAALAALAAALVLVVIVSSAWLRIAQSGLGCSGWPACYGAVTKTDDTARIAPSPQAAYTAEVRAAHRVAASAVGIVIAIGAVIWLSGERSQRGVTAVVLALLALTVFLALLGRFTPGAAIPAVTLGNLLGGMVLLALLWLLRLKLIAPAPPPVSRALAGAARVSLLLLAVQIVLGGLVSANYAALACATFPDCNGAWWPSQWSWVAFNPLQSYEALHGDTAQSMRHTLHIAHRCGAVLVACSIAVLTVLILRKGGALRTPGTVLAALLLLQIALGVALIVVPPLLALTVAHDVVAALLLAAVTAISYRLRAG